MPKYPLINEYGEINWCYQPRPIVQELAALGLASYDWYYAAYLSAPLTIELVQKIAAFAKQHQLEIEPYKEFDLSLDDPKTLVTHYYMKHLDMSHTDTNLVGRLSCLLPLLTNTNDPTCGVTLIWTGKFATGASLFS